MATSSTLKSHRVSITLHSRSSRSPSSSLYSQYVRETPASDETVKAFEETNFSPHFTTTTTTSTVKPIPSLRKTTTSTTNAAQSTTTHHDSHVLMNSSNANRRSLSSSNRKVLQTDIDEHIQKSSPLSTTTSSQQYHPKQPSPQSSIDSAFTSTASGASFMSRVRNSSGATDAGASSTHPRKKGPSFSSRRSSSGSESSGSEFELLDDDDTKHDSIRKGSSSPQAIRQCNRYGWFIDSEEAQDEETPLPALVIRRRESKWIQMTASDKKWTKYVKQRFRIVRKRCRKGIPHAVRGRAWFYLCGGHKALEKQPGLFERLDSQPGNDSINDEITKDLHRQFPTHEIFARKDGSGQQDLYRILKAYSILKPEIGYCQGQAPLAAVLLMIMPAEHAFFCLCSLCDLYLQGYFAPGLEELQLHGDMLFSLLRKFYPSAYKILKKQQIEPVLYMTEWFMCLFARTLPWPVVLRVWDMFMCEGIIVIFKVGIVLIGSILENEKKHCKSMYDTLQLLKNPPKKYQTENYLLHKVSRLDLTESEVSREHTIQMKNRARKKMTEDRRRKNLEQERQTGLAAKKLSSASISRDRQDIIRRDPSSTLTRNATNGSASRNNHSYHIDGTNNHGNNNSRTQTTSIVSNSSQRDKQEKYSRSISYPDSPDESRYSREPSATRRSSSSSHPRVPSPHHQMKQHRNVSSSSTLPSKPTDHPLKESSSSRSKEISFKSGTTRR